MTKLYKRFLIVAALFTIHYSCVPAVASEQSSSALFTATAQTYETQYRRPVSEVMNDVAKRFNVKFKFDANVDTAGVMLTYADFRIRPYSLEQTLDNICKHFDWNW